MIKGHVQIELHNHKTGARERIEGDNMITNALNYVIPNVIGGNYSASSIMPLCKKALGGLMLFDGTLTENKNNMFFPSEAHLVASASRGLNTSDADRGSLNSAETYATDTGYQSVWDFSTSQANGTIKSLALTLNASGQNSGSYVDNPYNFVSPFARSGLLSSTGSTDTNEYPLCYDVENQYLYYISAELGGSQSYDEKNEDTGKNVTKYKTEFHVMKTYFPTNKFKLEDDANPRDHGVEVTSFTIEMGTSYHDARECFRNGYDGYAYMITPIGTNGEVEMYKLKVSDYSFELSDKITFNCKSTQLYNYYRINTVSKGYAYIQSLDRASIYIVNLSNTVDITEAHLPSGWNFNGSLVALKNGGVQCTVSRPIAGTNNTEYRPIICYPDGKIIMRGSGVTTTSYYPMFSRVNLTADNLMVFGTVAYGYSQKAYGFTLNNYLGSIYNLPQPIVKTAASSMKVVYTLTNTD